MNFPFLVFLLLHSAVPALCSVLYGASPFWMVGSFLFSLAVPRTVALDRSGRLKIWLCLVSGIAMALTLMLGVSYYMQGTGFNAQFFYHVDAETLVIAPRAYAQVFFPAALALLLAFFAPLMFYPARAEQAPGAAAVVLLWCAALVTSYPIHSLVNYGAGRGDELSAMGPRVPPLKSMVEGNITQAAARSGAPGEEAAVRTEKLRKNIILIYAEGLEQLYFNEDIFGDLLPELRALSKQAHQFTNVYQVPGTSWTIAGIVASQCGFPLLTSIQMAANSTLASIEKPFEGETCFADILQDSGYRTVFMGGAPLAFAGKGNFLRTHGYGKVLGRDELTPRLPDPDYGIGWGLQDDSLFDLALEELESLENGEQAYLLTLLTLGTHHPNGYVAKSCSLPEREPDPMSRAIYCSDQLISRFIRAAMQRVDMQETLIVLFSDHLAMRNSLWSTLTENKEQRRLTWMMFDDQPATESDQVATHFDLAPTILDLAGFSQFAALGQGTSLYARAAAERSAEAPDIALADVPRSLLSDAAVTDVGFGISYADLTLSVGNLAVRATKNGWKFSSGLFLFLFNDRGHVVDTLYSEDFGQLLKVLDGRYVVGISIHGDDSAYEDQFFYGHMSPDLSRLRVRPLNGDVRVEPAELDF
jgi:phosphoglycerol transferase